MELGLSDLFFRNQQHPAKCLAQNGCSVNVSSNKKQMNYPEAPLAIDRSLYSWFSRLGCYSHSIRMTQSLTWLMPQLKCHLLKEKFPDHSIQKKYQHPSLSVSLPCFSFLCSNYHTRQYIMFIWYFSPSYSLLHCEGKEFVLFIDTWCLTW